MLFLETDKTNFSLFSSLFFIPNSQGKIQFNPQKIATKGFSTDSVRV